MFIVYLIIALLFIGVVLLLMAFAYPELLWRGAKGLLRLSIAITKTVIKFIVSCEKRIVKGGSLFTGKGPIDTPRHA